MLGWHKRSRRVFNYSISSLIILMSALAKADIKHIKVSTSTAYLKIEVLSDTLVHFELSTKVPGPEESSPIYTTPMVIPQNHHGPSSFAVKHDQYSTKDLDIWVEPNSLCTTISNRTAGYRLGVFCPHLSEQSLKGVSISAPEYSDLLGLGQNFPQPHELNPTWKGRTFIPGPFGNELRSFFGGAVGHMQIPVLYALGDGLRNFATFFDHPYKQRWDFQQDTWRMETWGDHIRWYVFAGENVQMLRKQFMGLTGHASLLPKSSYGFWMSEFGYESWDEIFVHKNSLQRQGIPFEGFGLDLQWYGGSFGDPDRSRMGTLQFDPIRFADPAQRLQALAAEGLQVMPIEQPYVGINLPEHQELANRGLFARDCASCNPAFLDYNPWWGRGGILDFSNPETGRFWHQWKRKPLLDLGVRAHWTDLGEPEMYLAHSWYYGLEGQDLHQHGDIHNLYNLYWAESIVTGYREQGIGERPMILTRSGTAGMQRYFTALWSGDIAANMTSMIAHQRAQHHLSLAGIDHYGSDIGGFYRPAGDGQEACLYSIWLANSLLTDVPARTHVWNLNHNFVNNPALIGDVASNRANIRLRYALLPYYYSLAYAAAKDAEPIVAPLLYYFQAAPQLRTIDLQKMIGPYLMAKLITSYDGSGKVIFPEARWFDFRTYAPISVEEIEVPATQNNTVEVPLYVRAGAIIPQFLNPALIKNSHTHDSALKLLVVPNGAPSSFTLYDDDGRSLPSKGVKKVKITQHARDGRILLSFGKQGEPWPDAAFEIHVIHQHPVKTVKKNGKPLEHCTSTGSPRPQECWEQNPHFLRIIGNTTEFFNNKNIELN